MAPRNSVGDVVVRARDLAFCFVHAVPCGELHHTVDKFWYSVLEGFSISFGVPRIVLHHIINKCLGFLFFRTGGGGGERQARHAFDRFNPFRFAIGALFRFVSIDNCKRHDKNKCFYLRYMV